eukprot:1044091-Pelagomonas_calceolata.AAC.3
MHAHTHALSGSQEEPAAVEVAGRHQVLHKGRSSRACWGLDHLGPDTWEQDDGNGMGMREQNEV